MKEHFKFLGKSLKYKDYLIVSDLHAGIESLLIEKGFNFPKIINKIMLDELKKLKEISNANILIINGDIKHEFSKEKMEMLDLRNFFKKLQEFWSEIIVIKGNHDLFIENIVKPLGIEVYKRLDLDNLVITHGDYFYEDFLEKKKTFIIGNEHPALKIPELGVEEPVFLFNKNLVVLPSFNPFLKGSNVLNKDFLSPYFNYVKGWKFKIIISKLENNEILTEEVGEIEI